MIGVRAGLRCGVVGGSRNGSGVDELGGGAASPMAGVAQDATSSKYMPANAAQWTTALSVAGIASGNPSALWLLQEASGNVADSIGAFTGTATGTLTYQTAVPGYSTKGIKTTGGAAGTLVSVSASLPDISVTSMLLYIVMRSSAAEGATRTIAQMGTPFGSDSRFDCTAASKLVATAGAATTTGTAAFLDGNVHPLVLKVDRTGAVAAGYSDQDRLSPAIGGAGKNLLLGGDNSQTNFASGGTYMYMAAFFAGAAELSDASVRTLLQTLGWTVAW